MSQVDDWSDGYTSDYLRDLNTYGPASANVPRPSSVVSHQVRYRAPDTSDIPLAPGQNPEDSVYSNASGARMGQLKPRSGYNPPAGGGYTAQTFPHETAGRRYAPAKKPAQVAKKSAVKKTAAKKQSQAEYHTGGALTQDESNVAERAASHRQSDLDWGELNGQALDAAARFLPALRLLSGFGVGAGSASVPETNFNRGLMGGVGRQVESMRAPDSEQPAPESSSIEDQFKNMPWYEDAKAHHEAVKKNMDDYGFALGMLKSTWDDIPGLAKLLMLPPVFKAGSPAAGASTAGNVWAEGRRAAAGDATAGAKVFEGSLGRMNGGAVHGAPTEPFAHQPATQARVGWRTGEAAEYPAGTGKFDQFGGWGESGRSAVGTGSAPASDGAAKLGEQTVSYKDSVALGAAGAAGREAATAGEQAAGWTSSLVQQLRAAGIPEDQIAASIARINAGAAGREAAAAGGQAAGREAAAGAGRAGEAAADGGVSELANAGNAGRGVAAGEQAAAERAGINAEIARANMEASDAFNAQLIQRIKAGTTTPDDRKVIWALAQAHITPYTPASDRAVVDAARAAGIIK